VPVTALALVLAAGLLHASWNLILKRSSERVVVAAWAMLLGAVVFTPTLVPAWPPPAGVWPFVGASAVVYVAYYGCLARAYGDGDFSLVYPVARGTAPAMLALWTVLFLGERPSPGGLLGIATILCGLVMLGGAPLWSRLAGARAAEDVRTGTDSSIRTPAGHRWRQLRAHTRGSRPAFLVAFFISVYSTLDGAAVRQWDPLPYLVLVFGLSGLAFVGMLAARGGTRVFRVLRTHFRPIAMIAVMTFVAYALVLRAFQIAPISYAGAAREVGIVFGALAGWLLLGERFGRIRTVGAVLVFAGIGLLALAG
jgi:drug/metabolite transporter (DMT)-like permease